jgi:hypothetical protein
MHVEDPVENAEAPDDDPIYLGDVVQNQDVPVPQGDTSIEGEVNEL